MIIALRASVADYLDGLHQLFADYWQYPVVLVLALTMLFGALILMCAWMLWWVAALLLLAWAPIALQWTFSNWLHRPALGLFCMLIALQSPHMVEHVAQMIEIHILGWNLAISHGVLGQFLDTEWLHFMFDTMLIPYCTIMLLAMFVGRPRHTIDPVTRDTAFRPTCWLVVLLPVALWHAAEHVVILAFYLRTGIVGSPGLLAHGGLLFHGASPIARPDLHFLYNAIETAVMILGYRAQRRIVLAAKVSRNGKRVL